jgi:DNA-binding CsgD family transcriptional regulator
MLNTFDLGVLVIDYYKNDYAFAYIDNILFNDYSNDEMLALGKANLSKKLLLQNEISFLEELQTSCVDFISQLPIKRRLNCVIYTCHSVKNKFDKLIPINMNFTPLLLGKNGELWIVLATLTLSTKTNKTEAFIEMTDSRERLRFSYKKRLFLPLKLKQLSPKQKQVLILNSRGYSEIETGEMLSISVNTVKFHKRNIMQKTNTQTMNEAFIYAYTHKLF